MLPMSKPTFQDLLRQIEAWRIKAQKELERGERYEEWQ